MNSCRKNRPHCVRPPMQKTPDVIAASGVFLLLVGTGD